ncbi:MAG: hypothetical protein ACK4J0_00280 [Candidatus Anstonellaceae archaeon]
MGNVKKTIIIDGREHFIAIDSSLEINEVEITATEPLSGKVVHISLSSLLRGIPQKEIGNNITNLNQENNQILSTSLKNEEEKYDANKVINDIFG